MKLECARALEQWMQKSLSEFYGVRTDFLWLAWQNIWRVISRFFGGGMEAVHAKIGGTRAISPTYQSIVVPADHLCFLPLQNEKTSGSATFRNAFVWKFGQSLQVVSRNDAFYLAAMWQRRYEPRSEVWLHHSVAFYPIISLRPLNELGHLDTPSSVLPTTHASLSPWAPFRLIALASTITSISQN